MNKRARNIIVGSTLLLGGIALFGFNRRKKLLYESVKKKVDEFGSPYSGPGDLTETGESCQASEAQIANAVSDFKAAMVGVGTNEDLIFSTTEQIGSKACWVKVSDAYREDTKRNLRSDIQNELKNIFGFDVSGDWAEWVVTYENLR